MPVNHQQGGGRQMVEAQVGGRRHPARQSLRSQFDHVQWLGPVVAIHACSPISLQPDPLALTRILTRYARCASVSELRLCVTALVAGRGRGPSPAPSRRLPPRRPRRATAADIESTGPTPRARSTHTHARTCMRFAPACLRLPHPPFNFTSLLPTCARPYPAPHLHSPKPLTLTRCACCAHGA